MGTPTRYTSGVSVFPKGTLLGNLSVPSHLALHEYSNDFDQYIAGDWTITTTAGSNALTAGNGGLITLTTAATNSDIQHMLKNPAAFAFVPGVPLWFGISIVRGDNVNNVIAGLQSGGTAFAPTSGVYFTCATGQNTVNAVINNGGTSTTITGIANLVPAVQTSLGFYYDGAINPTLWFFSSSPLTQAPTAFGQNTYLGGTMVAAAGTLPGVANPLTNLPPSTTNLSIGFGVQATAVAAKNIVVDYVVAANGMLRN